MTRHELGPVSSGVTPREQRMAAAGRVAAGLLHDFNNTLGTISNLAFVLERVADNPEKVRELAQRLAELTQARGRVIQRVRDFIRQDAVRFPDESPVDLAAIAREAVVLSGPFALSRGGDAVRVECLMGEPVMVAGDVSDLRAAAFELVLNAIEASPPGGLVCVRTGVDGGQAVLEVQDTGAGLREGMAETAFDPFISGKEEPDVGLGLSAAWSIARRHGGNLTLEALRSGGVVALLSLPQISVNP